MKNKKMVIGLLLMWCLILAAIAGGVTYAWFSFNPYTNVEPMSSTISSGGTALLISTKPDSDFGIQCVLPKSVSGDLEPISTADLEHFYAAFRQNRQGIANGFKNADDQVEDVTIQGEFYLQSLTDDCDVYFYRSGMDFGNDPQMLSALRLGMRITTNDQTYVYIFRLDDMGNTSSAKRIQTISAPGNVVKNVNDNKDAVFVIDPARALTEYFATPGTGEDALPKPGRESLFTLEANEVAKVEYWLYLEGCDDNCINDVQQKEARIQLSFAGVS